MALPLRLDAKSPFAPSAFRAARKISRLSLAELARRANTSRQYLQQLEEGRRRPSPALLEQLASELGFEVSFFLRPFKSEVPQDQTFLRGKAHTRLRDWDQARTYVGLFHDLVDHLGTELKFPRSPLPRATVTTTDQIEGAAQSCRTALGLQPSAPIPNITRAVERIGIFVTELEGIASQIDAFSARLDPPVIVRSPLKGSTSRARFDVAHELGHLVLHAEAQLGNRDQEHEADLFASALLLPRDAFVREFPRSTRWIWRDVFRLKLRWGTSVSAIVMRAKHLGLIDAQQERNAWQYISTSGWRRAPEPEEPPIEIPELIIVAFRELHRVQGMRPRDVVAEMGWTENVLRRVVSREQAYELDNIGGGAIVVRLEDARPNLKPRREDGRSN